MERIAKAGDGRRGLHRGRRQTSDFLKRLISCGLGNSPFPRVNDQSTVDAIDGVQDSLSQFLRRGHADVAKHGSRELGEEPLDEVELGTVFGRIRG